MPINRLAQLVLNNGGKTLDEAVAGARARLEEIKHIAFEGIEGAIAALEKLVTEAGEDGFTELQMEDVLSYTDRLLTLTDAFELHALERVSQSLADLALGLNAAGIRAPQPIAVHVRAARLLAPTSPPIAEDERQRLLDELKRLVARFLYNSPIPADEEHRQAVLERLNVLDMAPEEQFERLTKLAATYFKVPIALISLVDDDRQWFMSKSGLDTGETPRDVSFCAHAIMGDAVFVVLDATKDPRFAGSPLVVNDPKVRFYAGAPLISVDGARLGTLCIIDRQPREEFSDADRATLTDLARRVVDMIYARAFHWLSDQDPELAVKSLREASDSTQAAARTLLDTASAELREPLNSILALSSAISAAPERANNVEELRRIAQAISSAAQVLMRTLHSTIAARAAEHGEISLTEEPIDVADLLSTCALPYVVQAEMKGVDISKIDVEPGLPPLLADRPQTEQMFIQLLAFAFRAAKRSDQVRVKAFKSETTGVEIEVSVSRPQNGDKSANQSERAAEASSPNFAIAKRLVEMHGGRLRISGGADADCTIRLCFPAYRTIAEGTPLARAVVNGSGPAS
ncbi:MAG TPA: GAF domain-containing protein [Alphaproteobacteria bacterium]|nr:GAF domain-containing protein [Alphaproteobacteria bacterium]